MYVHPDSCLVGLTRSRAPFFLNTGVRSMADALIENPILNSPFLEPKRHFKFTDEGITNEIVDGRRSSSYFIPIARPKKKGKQLSFDTEWTQDRIEENKTVNRIRQRVGIWREGGYVGVTPTTAGLLRYWTDPERERKLFFCQIEALETLIYLTEVAKKFGDAWIENDVHAANDTSNPGLPRLALKMATGSGKTVVIAMLIAWQALNKLANHQDARFSDTFLIVSPGITIRDRLRVLLPNDPTNYYRLRDVVPGHQFEKLGQARIIITNFHAFQLREKISAGKLTKAILSQGVPGVFTESPDQMVRRVCRELGTKKNIIVINDEAHHCYRRKPEAAEAETLTGDDRKEAEKRAEEARIWISGIEAVKAKIGVKAIYDLSATPFFLKGWRSPSAGWMTGTSIARTTRFRSSCCCSSLPTTQPTGFTARSCAARTARRTAHRHSGRFSGLMTRSARPAMSISTRPGPSTRPAPTGATSPTWLPTPTVGNRRWPRLSKRWAR